MESSGKSHSDMKEYGSYDALEQDFVGDVLQLLKDADSEISERNQKIRTLDDVIYGNGLTSRLSIPFGHDKTEVNWLKRAVEIHAEQFMGNGFQVISTYNSEDVNASSDPSDKKRAQAQNKSSKNYAEMRADVCRRVIEDNGGMAMFKDLAKNAGAIGDTVIKMYYDDDAKTVKLSQVEAVENVYVVWGSDDFRRIDAVAYVYQISQANAARWYGCDENTPTSLLGQPLNQQAGTVTTTISNQKMVTVIEITGTVPEWAVKDGKLKEVSLGKETELNALIVGNKVKRLISSPKKIPRYYILPNKRERRRPWGVSDITDAAIDINLTYIETLSDWRTVAAKVNFPKFKAFGFGPDVTMPKPTPRTVEVLPLADGQDIQFIDQGDANQIDFKAQMEELKEQFIRETGLSRVLFSDPTITLNSNQALMTSMKPTTDIAEAKKALWAPILSQMFTDMLFMLAEYDETVKELVKSDDDWTVKVVYPEYIAKYDPSAFAMLLNRFNAGLISAQSFMEALGESKEEIDRIGDELEDRTTAAILGKQLPILVQQLLGQPPANGNPSQPNSMINTTANNVPGSGIMSQPGSGQATTTSPEGAVAQTAQNLGA